MRKPLLQMTSFWLSYLAVAVDNLYIHELLGYMRCLFFKAVTESFIFFPFFFVCFVLFLFGWFLLYRNTCVVSIVYKTIYGCIILIMTLKLCEKSFENFSSLILKLWSLSLSSVQVCVHKTKWNKETWDRLAINRLDK